MKRTVNPTVCRECPWRRASPPGFLGSASGDPWAFAGHHIHGVEPLPCHLRVDWERRDAQEQARKAPLCRGFAIFMSNAMIAAIDPEIHAATRTVSADHEAVFSNYQQFHEHHSNPKLAKAFSK